MKTIVIGGATGAVGRGLVRYFVAGGHRVIAIVRDDTRRAELEILLSRQETKKADTHILVNAYENEAQIADLQAQLAKLGTIDMAIASLGGWYHGPKLGELPLSEWDTVVNNSLSSHFRFAKAVLPLLEKQATGAYILINGGAAEYPVAHSGVISVMAAAQKMMAQVLHHEASPHGVRVFGVAAFSVVKTDRTAHLDELWLSAEAIAEFTLQLVDTHDKSGHYWHKLQTPEDLLI